MEHRDLTPEQREKAKACKSAEDILSLANEEGYELSDEQLEAVSGGDWDCWSVCTKYKHGPTCPMDCIKIT